MRTLREVCKELNISRRVVQGYQSKGLIQPDGRNKFDHLLFEEQTIDRIGFVRFCQKLDMSTEEIIEIIDLPTEELLERLKQKEERMRLAHLEMAKLLERTEQFLNKAKKEKSFTNQSVMESIRKEIL